MRKLKSWLGNPTYVLAIVGFAGFAVDMFLKPISNAGLILLGVACAPWLARLLKSAEFAGFKFVLSPSAPAQSLASKLSKELDPNEADSGGITDDTEKQSDASGMQYIPTAPASGGPIGRIKLNKNLAEGYLLEGLAIRDLQSDLPGMVQRDVRLRDRNGRFYDIDGLIVRDVETVAVEVRHWTHRKPKVGELSNAISRLISSVYFLREHGYANPRGILVVLARNSEEASKMETAMADEAQFSSQVQVRFTSADELMNKYGFAAI